MDKFGVIQPGVTPERDDSPATKTAGSGSNPPNNYVEKAISDQAEERCSNACKCRKAANS